MDRQSSTARLTGDKAALLSNVALLYYGEGLTQNEIARRMNVSRATIVNMLRESRELGIVEIRVEGRHLTGSSLSRDLRELYSIEDVYVALTNSDGLDVTRKESLSQLARAASAAMLDIVEPGDRIGVAWGETIMALADSVPRCPIAELEVVQLIGSMISDRVPASENCTIQIASQLGAKSFTLHAPGLISSSELAGRLREEPTIRAQMERLKSLDLAIFSIGSVKPWTHLVAAGIASPQELAAARDAGAVGIVCCRYLDAVGRELKMPPHDRLIAAGVSDLRSARKKLMVVSGENRRDAALAALRGGLVTHLCVDQSLGLALLEA